jgi:hypothetical protein
LEKEFKLKPHQTSKKAWQLIEADLATERHFQEIRGLDDEVFLIVLMKMYSSKIMDELTEEEMEKLLSQEMEQRIRSIAKEEIQPMEKAIKSLSGHVNVLRGNTFEYQVKQALLKGKISLENYRIISDINSVNISLPGAHSYQIDLVAYLEEKTPKAKKARKKAKIALAVEVKNWKDKISSTDAQKFLNAVKELKKIHKLTHIVTMYVSRSGFSKPAAELLQKHKVRLLTLADIEKLFEPR